MAGKYCCYGPSVYVADADRRPVTSGVDAGCARHPLVLLLPERPIASTGTVGRSAAETADIPEIILIRASCFIHDRKPAAVDTCIAQERASRLGDTTAHAPDRSQPFRLSTVTYMTSLTTLL